jgi:hypothetical protein
LASRVRPLPTPSPSVLNEQAGLTNISTSCFHYFWSTLLERCSKDCGLSRSPVFLCTVPVTGFQIIQLMVRPQNLCDGYVTMIQLHGGSYSVVRMIRLESLVQCSFIPSRHFYNPVASGHVIPGTGTWELKVVIIVEKNKRAHLLPWDIFQLDNLSGRKQFGKLQLALSCIFSAALQKTPKHRRNWSFGGNILIVY